MGEIAALLTSACWAFSGIFFTAAGKKIGAFSVNRLRLSFAVFLFLITHFIIFKSFIPLNTAPVQWMWLALSGIVGLVLGDTLLYQAFIYLGVRIPTLVMASVPVISTLLAWIFLDENLAFSAIMGVTLTILGIGLVVFDRSSGQSTTNQPKNTKQYLIGLLCALGGAIGQASGLVLAKFGLQNNIPVLSGTLIRMLAALFLIWVLALFQGQARKTIQMAVNNPKSMKNIFYGSIIGPYIGVWLSLFAIQTAFVGTASTLMALAPIILLPISKWVYKEELSRLSIIGTFVTIIGVSIIFLG